MFLLIVLLWILIVAKAPWFIFLALGLHYLINILILIYDIDFTHIKNIKHYEENE